MPNVHPLHLRRAFRRAAKHVAIRAAVQKRGDTPESEAMRAIIRKEVARMSDEEVEANRRDIMESLRNADA